MRARATWFAGFVRGGRGSTPRADAISDGDDVPYEELLISDWRSSGTRVSGLVDNYVPWLAHCAEHNGNLEIAIWCGP